MKKSEIFGNAEFVRPDAPCVSPIFFDKFACEKGLKTEITVTGLGFFYLYINGKRVSEDIFAPVTSNYHHHENCFCFNEFGEKMQSRIYAQKYDITDFVKAGENTVSVFTGPGWYANYSDHCVACFTIKNEKGVFESGKTTRWLEGPLSDFRFTKGETQDFTKLDYSLCFSEPERLCSFPCKTEQLPQTEYYISDCPNDKVIRQITPVLIGSTEEYDLYDAGENISGTVVFTCGESGKTVEINAAEEITDNITLSEKNHHGQKAVFVCGTGSREYRLLFTWHAFRYFTITKGTGAPHCDVIHADVSPTAQFKSENKVLNWLFDAYIRTQLSNMHAGIPSDCPHLERRGYTGDGQLTCEAVMLMTDSEKFYRKWIGDIEDCQDTVSGHVQYTAPYVRSGGGPGGWGCAIAEVPYIFYRMFGDPEPFRACFDKVLHYFDYLEAHSENDLVVSDQAGEWCLGDWCTPHDVHAKRPEIPEPFVNNYFYIKTIDRLLEMCGICGRDDKKEELLKLRSIKVSALNREYYDPDSGDYAKNLNSANAFAVDIGLGDKRTFDNLLNHVRTAPTDTGIFGTDLVVKVLCENGYIADAVSFLSREEYPSFGFMMNNNATTLWEEWKEPRSMSHPMFGSAVKYLFYYLLGIRQNEGSCAFSSVTVAPFANEQTGRISGSIATKFGKISVCADPFEGTCTVKAPKGIELNVVFNGKAETERY